MDENEEAPSLSPNIGVQAIVENVILS